MSDSTMSPDEMARACADAMYKADFASQALGITIDEVGPGQATVRMQVNDAMINGHEICHGGYVFLLADTAFAFACNTHNEVTVAATADIVFLAPARRGEVLVADARELHRSGRSGVYDVTVRNASGIVAEFRGVGRTIKGRLV